jgi:hypothetical protein
MPGAIPVETIQAALVEVQAEIDRENARLNQLTILRLMLVYGLTEEDAQAVLLALVALGLTTWTSIAAIALLPLPEVPLVVPESWRER